MIKDCIGAYGLLAKVLNEFFDEFLSKLPEFLKKLTLPIPQIEIWSDPYQIHTSEEIAEFMTDPTYHPDESDGEVWKGKIILYAETSNLPTNSSLEDKVKHFKHVLIHELGHYLYDYLEDKGLLIVEEWDRARERDGGDGRQIFFNYSVDLIENFGFYNNRTRSEDFAESFVYFFYFPNRFAFLQKLIESI